VIFIIFKLKVFQLFVRQKHEKFLFIYTLFMICDGYGFGMIIGTFFEKKKI